MNKDEIVAELRRPRRLMCGINCSIESDGSDEDALTAADLIESYAIKIKEQQDTISYLMSRYELSKALSPKEGE